MDACTRPTASPPDTAADDPRVGHLLGTADGPPRAVLVGFPSDEGVRRNGGRPGAADAPAHIRQQLYKLTPPAPAADAFTDLLAHTHDLGDLVVSGDVAADQQRLGSLLARYLADGVVPIVLGGGHETAYGHFLGYVESGQDVHLLNWDAHADVRPLKDDLPHSGSPFRQALGHANALSYHVAGLQPHSAAAAHVRFIEAHRGRVTWREDLTLASIPAIYDAVVPPTLVTMDMDAVDAAFAPGVSAPAAHGLTPEEWLLAARAAGRCPAVSSFDVVEVSPAFDIDGRTARLAALTIWQFLWGLAERADA